MFVFGFTANDQARERESLSVCILKESVCVHACKMER